MMRGTRFRECIVSTDIVDGLVLQSLPWPEEARPWFSYVARTKASLTTCMPFTTGWQCSL